VKLWQRAVGLRNEPGAGIKRNMLTLNDLMSVFTDPETAILPSSWGNIGNEELVGSVAEAYEQNGPVFALILARMQVFSQARFQWTRFTGGTPNDFFGSADLSVLEFPSNGKTTADLLAHMEVDASLAGNAFVRRVKAGPNEPQDRLVRLRPEWCTIVMGSHEMSESPWMGADVEEVGIIYRPNGDYKDAKFFSTQRFQGAPAEVAHYAPLPDPLQHFRGMSWVTPVLRSVMADDASEAHKLKFFQNAATPNFALKFDPGTTKEQILAFKEIFEEQQVGALNAYKTLFLGGGADPVTLGKDFVQLAFAETQGKGESRLAAAAGVPPSWVGFSEGLQGSALNAGNFTAARRRFADGTLHHLWAAAARSLEPLIVRPPSRPNEAAAQLWYDTRSIPFLRDDAKDHSATQQQEASTMRTLIDAGFEPASVTKAVATSDWSVLKHTGLYSVQLQPPNSNPTASASPAPQPTPGGSHD
jgi:phage portal protein BeeE